MEHNVQTIKNTEAMKQMIRALDYPSGYDGEEGDRYHICNYFSNWHLSCYLNSKNLGTEIDTSLLDYINYAIKDIYNLFNLVWYTCVSHEYKWFTIICNAVKKFGLIGRVFMDYPILVLFGHDEIFSLNDLIKELNDDQKYWEYEINSSCSNRLERLDMTTFYEVMYNRFIEEQFNIQMWNRYVATTSEYTVYIPHLCMDEEEFVDAICELDPVLMCDKLLQTNPEITPNIFHMFVKLQCKRKVDMDEEYNVEEFSYYE